MRRMGESEIEPLWAGPAAQSPEPRAHRVDLAGAPGASVRRADDLVADTRGVEQLEGLREVARGNADVVAAFLEEAEQRSEERHLRRVRHVDPDLHAPASSSRPRAGTRPYRRAPGSLLLGAPALQSGGQRRSTSWVSFAMDTRQLAAFCAVVERRSFSQAAERLGVTQPAVSLQVRALEKRLGDSSLDRSGRRVEPTEAGLRFYRAAQRLLQLEEQMLDDVASESTGALTGELSIGASTGPAAVVVPILLCEFHERHPGLHVSLEVHDTQTVVDLVADRGLELGIVGAARRHRAVRFEPILEDEVILICPPEHSFAGRTVSLDELRSETVILMQEGAGVRQVVEDELRSMGVRLRDLSIALELGLQESVRSAVQAGYGVTFISRSAVESDLALGTLAEARLEGMNAKREIALVRATGRSQTRAAEEFVAFVRERERP